MATLSNPTLQVDILTGSYMARVTATVNVGIDMFDLFPFSVIELGLSVLGKDGGFNGGDDDLLLFPKQTVNGGGLYTFSGVVPRAWLDEDNGNDEIYSRFDLLNRDSPFPFNVVTTSPIVTGEFGI
jgi:hypothetical protein